MHVKVFLTEFRSRCSVGSESTTHRRVQPFERSHGSIWLQTTTIHNYCVFGCLLHGSHMPYANTAVCAITPTLTLDIALTRSVPFTPSKKEVSSIQSPSNKESSPNEILRSVDVMLSIVHVLDTSVESTKCLSFYD